MPIAAGAIDIFHHRFHSAQDDLIFFEADPAWSRAIDAETERKFFARIRRKMGSCSYLGPSGWTVNSTPSGTLITLNYQASCARGPMRETFTWRIIDRKALLVAYNVNSNLLLTD